MPTIRRATTADAALIAQQRIQMFQDNQLPCSTTWDELERVSVLWLADKIESGDYVGLLLEDEKGLVVGGAGVWFMEWPPHFLHLEPKRAYLLNFYVIPEARGHGLAKQLVRAAEDVCRERRVRVATLHASPMGKPIYAALGWKEGNEMMKRFNQDSLDTK